MSERAGPIVSGRGLEYSYPGSERALAGVDADVAAGELVVVLGPNGSGKSTLVKLLAGLLQPDVGRVTIEGRDIAEWTPRERARHVALVPQFLPALPDVTVREFVTSGRYARARGGVYDALLGRVLGPTDERAVQEALTACEALELEGRAMTALSGGQRQRILVARALAQEAAVLLVDEPTNALDPEHQIQVFELLARAAVGDRGALVVTHDLNLAAQFATRIVLLHEGRVAAHGSPTEVLTPRVLEPVYGRHLRYIERTGAESGRAHIVLPSRNPR